MPCAEKVELEAAKMPAEYRQKVKAIRFALPFFKATAGHYTHRVRFAAQHWEGGELHHISVAFWCGGSGFMRRKARYSGELMAVVPPGGVLCATCEGRAIGAGLVDSGTINGRPVEFSPRRTI